MPNIIGEFSPLMTTVPPLDGHLGHLRHLTNLGVARDVLRERHQAPAGQVREISKLFTAHVNQALNFHIESRSAIPAIRPVLQYYCYLNLAVAAIIAYRPPNHDQYRRHGVEDKTYALEKIELGSIVLAVNRGALPLFHSIFSDVPLGKRTFRFGEIASGFHMFAHELHSQFHKQCQAIFVHEEVRFCDGIWRSAFGYFERENGNSIRVTSKRLEQAMPILKIAYSRSRQQSERTEYISNIGWSTEKEALEIHRLNGIKLINYGGHAVSSGIMMPSCHYIWRGVAGIPLIPTLSSVLLLSFSMASIVRYRPILLDKAMSSPAALLIDTFTTEADTVFIPALRNLLYREEVAIGPVDYV